MSALSTHLTRVESVTVDLCIQIGVLRVLISIAKLFRAQVVLVVPSALISVLVLLCDHVDWAGVVWLLLIVLDESWWLVHRGWPNNLIHHHRLLLRDPLLIYLWPDFFNSDYTKVTRLWPANLVRVEVDIMSCLLVIPVALCGLVKVVLLMKTADSAVSIEKLQGARHWMLLLSLRSADKLIKQVSILLTLHSIWASFSASFKELTLKGLVFELFDLRVDLVRKVQVGLCLLLLLLWHDTWIDTSSTPVKGKRLGGVVLWIQWGILLERALALLVSLCGAILGLVSW